MKIRTDLNKNIHNKNGKLLFKTLNLFLVMLFVVYSLPIISPVSIGEANADEGTGLTITFTQVDNMKFYEYNDELAPGVINSNQELGEKVNDITQGANFTFFASFDPKVYMEDGIKIESSLSELSQSAIKKVDLKDGDGNKIEEKTGYICKITHLNVSTTITVSNFSKRTYTVKLPKKIEGIDTLEYDLSYGDDKWISYGSVAGKTDITTYYGTKIRFSLRLKSEGYGKMDSSKIKLNKIDANGNNTEYTFTGSNGSNSSYLSKEVEIDQDCGFEITGIEKDQYTISFVDSYTNGTDDINTNIGEMTLDAVTFTSGGDLKEFNKDENEIKIAEETVDPQQKIYKMYYKENSDGEYKEITPDYGTYLKFKLTPNKGYDESKPQLKAIVGEKTFNVIKDGEYWSFRVTNNTELTLQDVVKNQYKVSIPSKAGLKYEYKIGDNTSTYSPVNSGYILADYGDNIYLKITIETGSGLDISTLGVNPEKYTDATPNDAVGYKVYQITGISSDIDTQVNIQKIQYNVYLGVGDDVTNEGSSYNILDSIKFYNIYGEQLKPLKENETDKSKIASTSVSHGSNLQFTIDVDHKYSQSSKSSMKVYYVKDNVEVLLTPTDGVYTVQGVTGTKSGDSWEAGKIVVKGLQLNRYNLTFKNEKDKFQFVQYGKDEENNTTTTVIEKVTVKYGDTYTFGVEGKTGYSVEGSSVTANGVDLRKNNGKYKIGNISEDYTIELTNIAKAKYKIEFPQDQKGVTFVNGSGIQVNMVNVEYQGSYEFDLKFESSYSKSKDRVKVYAVPLSEYKEDGEPKAEYQINKKYNEKYTISNVSEGMKVVVTGVEINKYSVVLPAIDGIGYTVYYNESEGKTNPSFLEGFDENTLTFGQSGKFNIAYGEEFYFKINADKGYDISEVTVVNAKMVSGGYVIEGIVQDTNVEILGLKAKKYNVTFKDTGVTFYKANSIDAITSEEITHESGTLNFTVSVNRGWNITENQTLTVNVKKASGEGTAQATLEGPSATNVYTLKEVTEDVIITVDNVEVSKLQVTLPNEIEGIEFYDGEGSPFKEGEADTNTPKVNYGSDLTFEVRAKYGYDVSDITVTAGDNYVDVIYTGSNSSIYTVREIKTNLEVKVSNVKKRNYSVTLKGENLTFYNETGTTPLSGGQEVEYKGSLKFKINANTGYNIKNGVKFYLLNDDGTKNEQELQPPSDDTKDELNVSNPNGNGVYTINNVTKRTVIMVEGAVKNEYSITFPSNEMNDKVIFKSGNTSEAVTEIEAEYLSERELYIEPKEGYNIDSIDVSLKPVGNASIKKVAEGYYVIYDITDNVVVNVSGVELNEYNVTLKSDGVDFYTESGTQISNFKIKYGQSDKFVIQAKKGYNLNSYEIKVIGIDSEETKLEKEKEGYTYILSGVKRDITISVENVSKDIYDVKFPTNVTGITFKDINYFDINSNPLENESKVSNGGWFEFKIEALEGYSIDSIIVKANSDIIELKDGKYTVSDVRRNITISVEGVKPKQLSVKLNYADGVIYTDEYNNELSTLTDIKVAYNGKFKFKVKLVDAYNQSKMVVRADKSKLESDRGVYTLSEIKEDTNITVTGVEVNTYNLTLTQGEGYHYLDRFGQEKLSENQRVKHGESFNFMVEANEGYDISNLIVTAANGNSDERVVLSPVDGVYSVTEMTEDYTIVVENIVKATYKLEITATEGVSVLDTSKNQIKGQISVKHGDSVSFMLSLGESYNSSHPVVTIKGGNKTIEPVNGIYTVSDIRGDTIVEVSGITKNTYTITLQKAEGVVYKNSRNKVIEGNVEVEWNDTFIFKVTLMDAYDASKPLVMVDDKLTLSENGGVYELTNITGNRTISVKNVKQNPEEAVIGMIISLPEHIENMGDAQAVVSASRAFLALSEDEQKLVTNFNDFQNAQEEAAKILHTSNGIEVSDIDWYIQVIVTPLSSDEASIQRLSDKVDRKSILSLYEITLWDTLRNEKYVLPSDVSVTVVVPVPDLTGYKNEVIVHEKSSGNIEYLDVLINNGYAQFETSSFSVFGVAAKKVPNYVEKPSDITISVSSIADDNTIKQVLADDDVISSISSNVVKSNSSSNPTMNIANIEDLNEENVFSKSYNWAVEHEFIVSVVMILLFSSWIAIIVIKSKKKEK